MAVNTTVVDLSFIILISDSVLPKESHPYDNHPEIGQIMGQDLGQAWLSHPPEENSQPNSSSYSLT
ncbi:hypothetical protein RintRC_4518 [Richelia intracellularis]|nr:hypothetical protein RintRC_4518 [Richelia intracellularis]